jgi:hypothetical protein
MAFTVWEYKRSGRTSWSEQGASRTAILKGKYTTDPDEAEAGFLAALPPAIAGIGWLKGYEIDPVGGGCWDCSATYGPGKRQQQGDPTKWSFETTGGSAHVEHSLETMGQYRPEGADPIDFKGLIGVTKDGVQGADVTIPVLNLRGTVVLPYSYVTPYWMVAQAYLTGRVNWSAWKGFAPGEVLNLGCSGGLRGATGEDSEADWEITWALACGPNLMNLTIGDIVGIQKRAWEYLWQYHETFVGNAGDQKFLIQKPLAVTVERVYEYGDFSGIPL